MCWPSSSEDGTGRESRCSCAAWDRAPVEVLAGPGIVIDVGRRADVRLGLHFALTSAAPDLVFDAWVSKEFPVW